MIARLVWCALAVTVLGSALAPTALPADSSDGAGRLVATGNRLDIAIDGTGFIEVVGPRGQVLLWRGGTLRIDDAGMLATQNGFPLRAEITVPVDSTRLEIRGDGEVRSLTWDSVATLIGQIMLAKLTQDAPPQRTEGGFYVAANPAALQHVRPGESGTGGLLQGSIERR